MELLLFTVWSGSSSLGMVFSCSCTVGHMGMGIVVQQDDAVGEAIMMSGLDVGTQLLKFALIVPSCDLKSRSRDFSVSLWSCLGRFPISYINFKLHCNVIPTSHLPRWLHYSTNVFTESNTQCAVHTTAGAPQTGFICTCLIVFEWHPLGLSAMS